MSNFGGGEMIAVFLLALIVLGPERLPKVARQAGQMMRQVRQMSAGFQEELRNAIEDPKPSDFHGTSISATAEAEAELTADPSEISPSDDAVDAPPDAEPGAPVGDRRLSAVPEPELAEEVVAEADGDAGQSPSGGSRAAG